LGCTSGFKANKDKLTSDHRRRGFQACAVRRDPWQSCSSSVVGQGWRRPGSEHWRSCSRSRQWTWRDKWRAGELRWADRELWLWEGAIGGGGKGDQVGEVRAAQDTQCNSECRNNVQWSCQKEARRRLADVIGRLCGKVARRRMRVHCQEVDRQVETNQGGCGS
jgi:hypothetical protein